MRHLFLLLQLGRIPCLCVHLQQLMTPTRLCFALLLLFFLPLPGRAQPSVPAGATLHAGATPGEDTAVAESVAVTAVQIPEHIGAIVDSLALVNEIHGSYVGFSGATTRQYEHFIQLSQLACPEELLLLTSHENAVVRAYAFWALARQQYEGLEKVLLEHARDEALVREVQGGMVTTVPLIDFMQWVVDPDLLDTESKKLDTDVFRQISEIRFSDR